jgi:LuxR family transcriptional regulator, positive regulator of biofilm formation
LFPTPLPTVLFNVVSSSSIEKEFLRRGYKGVFFKESSLSLIEKGMKKVFEGNLWFSRQTLQEFVMEELHMVSNDVAETVPPLTKDEEDALDILTPREEEILLLVASGAKNKNIAENLCLSPHTVRGHISSVSRQLKVDRLS